MRSKECDVITKCFMTLRTWQLSAHFSAVYRDSARLRSPEVRNTLVCHGEIDELSIVCCYGVASDALLHRRWAPSDSLDTRRRDGAYTREYQAPEQRHKPFYEMKNIRRHFSRRLIQCGVQMIYIPNRAVHVLAVAAHSHCARYEPFTMSLLQLRATGRGIPFFSCSCRLF